MMIRRFLGLMTTVEFYHRTGIKKGAAGPLGPPPPFRAFSIPSCAAS
jgi:hypothetical protein